ncbi:golgin subfamily A member 1 [Protobothrops mucrosquamatus]|uniref:golgin subfamily A member 1 n=1 Tax=Protobothrops mucrosquamatus TaxID=103944 RepID=UPI0007758482|nr:golgin subfamily A member 1 [Protobothrops mucrosquamatus]
MFAKLKKKIADEAATAPRPGGLARMPRSISKESVTSAGADSGDDFPSDGSSSREDLSSQLFRRNDQIRKLEVKLSDYAEQVRNLQKIKEKLENALETHQDSFVKKLQEQNETHQASVAKMAEGMSLALERKDQEWREKLSHLEKERKLLSAQLQEMREQSLNLFQKRDEIDELEGFQQQELAKIKHMLLKKEESLARMEGDMRSSTQELLETRDELQASRDLSSRLTTEVEGLQQQQRDLTMERDELQNARASAENKITSLEERSQDLQSYVQRVSVDLQKAQLAASSAEKSLDLLQGEHKSLKLDFQEQRQKMAVQVEEKTQLVGQLQEKVATLEKRLEGSLSGDEHFQQLFREVADLTLSLQEKEQQMAAKTDSLLKREEEAKSLRQGHDLLLLQMHQLQSSLDSCNGQAAEREAALQEQLRILQMQLQEQQERLLANEKQAAVLELTSIALEDHLHLSEDGEAEPNGELVSSDAVRLQKENRDLEQQIVEKNKMIKQLQQRMAELKKTLQKELKIRPDGEVPEVPTAGLTVTNNCDLSDSREVNFEYLKHVVLKFMSSRESEALHLIKALSVLLSFSPEEENMVKETLEYKMSWFGSKPLPRGTVRPSISNPRTMWS